MTENYRYLFIIPSFKLSYLIHLEGSCSIFAEGFYVLSFLLLLNFRVSLFGVNIPTSPEMRAVLELVLQSLKEQRLNIFSFKLSLA